MEAYLLNQQLQRVDLIEGYESFIWTERFDAHGDSVLDFSASVKKPSDFPKGYYLNLVGSDDLMKIVSSELEYDSEKGRTTQIKGKALTSLLDQRIVWSQTNISSLLEPAVNKLLDENIIAATNTNRRITNLVRQSAGSTVPSVYSVKAQFQGEKLYKALSDLCEPFDVGFRIRYDGDSSFIFQLYGGKNRSYSNGNTLPYVVFSPEFDNLEKAQLFSSMEEYCNVVLVGGEGEGNKKKFRTVNRTGANVTGVNRYEDYYKADNQSSNDDEMTPAEYNAFLDQVGAAYLKENGVQYVFDGETDPTTSSGYGVSYMLGDLVQISDPGLINTPARIVEYIRSDDVSNGIREFPALRIEE